MDLTVELMNIVLISLLILTINCGVLFWLFDRNRSKQKTNIKEQKRMIETLTKKGNTHFRYFMKILGFSSEEFTAKEKRAIVDHIQRLTKFYVGRPLKIGCFEIDPVFFGDEIVSFRILGFNRVGVIENI